MKIYQSVTELIGNTPILELQRLKKELFLKANIFAKLESFNPAGSIKDRVALAMIEDAERAGLLVKGSVIIEPTSGNTGIGIALVAKVKGYKAVIVMPDNMSVERINLLKAYGAKVVLTDSKLGMKGAIAKAEDLKRTLPYAVILGQFDNLANPEAHYKTTGKEIYDAFDGRVDFLVAGIGTGGTISGTGKYLKENIDGVKIVGVEPLSSPLLTKGTSGSHKIQGIGANFIPKTLDLSVIDFIEDVSDEDAYNTAKLLSLYEGIIVGVSSSASLVAAIKLASLDENAGKNIVVIFPDSGERYLSTEDYLK
ncbi:MAG: cysteine synthase A [Clostridia bacterium]|nr:cysteine synthase A [Clostridia bacterium]